MLSLLDKEADAVIARGKNAEKLKEALAEMKASLHPAQLEKLQMLGELLEPFQKAPTSKFQPAFGKRPAGFPPEPPRP
ncbi:hypothetical protein CEV33_3556 [Brucella grignonensis]|uniref:Uncharacterized protein n=2 Tax=Brucella grignonensis TaxID=94627 RepID=A0A256EZ56_9HYPH|nr:hypothetical protein CEV33_3556 [Brucella grignonensis]